MAFSYIDIFAGAGGLSEGFQRNGYIPVAHVEMKKEACFTLKTRECFYYLKKHGRIEDYKNYLRKEITRDELYAMVPEEVLDSVINETMSEEGMPALFDRIDHLMEMQGIENVDVLVGGPPCQACVISMKSGLMLKRKSLKHLHRNIRERTMQPRRPDIWQIVRTVW